MRIPILTFGAIASIIAINSVFANTVVTSQTYVDNADALKQNKIDATGANFTNGSVVETTGTDGVVTQRGIFNPETDFDFENYEIANGHEGDLVTADIYDKLGVVAMRIPVGTGGAVPVYNRKGVLGTEERGIYDGSTIYNSSTDSNKLVTASALQNVSYEINNMPEKTVTHRTCTRWIDGQSHTDANCLLWNLVDETVYGAQCNTNVDCAGYIGDCTCINHMCDCEVE